MSMEALERSRSPHPLSNFEYKLHFFPWWNDPKYQVFDAGEISAKAEAYFKKLEKEDQIFLADSQKLWYSTKLRTMGEAMLREFPSTVEEAFKAPTENAMFSQEWFDKNRVDPKPYDYTRIVVGVDPTGGGR